MKAQTPWMLVTGAASGIGFAIAEKAAARGYNLLLVDRSSHALSEATKAISQSTRVVSFVADVTDLPALEAGMRDSLQSRAPITAVAHSAGIEVLGTVDELNPHDWARCIDVNLTGTFNVARVGLAELLKTRGSLTLIASDAGVTGAQGYAAYCASKHGVIGLMRAMALDYGPRGVRVNAVAPSFVETPMADRIFEGYEDDRAYYKTTVPLGRFAAPTEIAQAVMHLASDEASYTTGSVYRIDGGATTGYFQPPPA